MKWTVERPRVVAEDDKLSVEVEANTIEEAVKAASKKLYGHDPSVGDVYNVYARVEVTRRPLIPLRSV
jgi:hypothetical protein